MVVEEVLPFLEENIKVAAMGILNDIGIKTFYGKIDKTFPSVGELNPEIVAAALSKIMKVKPKSLPAGYLKEIKKIAPLIPPREQTFCPGCPHRASFWNINTALKLDDREGIVCGDIGCYAMASLWAGDLVSIQCARFIPWALARGWPAALPNWKLSV